MDAQMRFDNDDHAAYAKRAELMEGYFYDCCIGYFSSGDQYVLNLLQVTEDFGVALPQFN
jgi:hypothetical protein